MTCTIIVFAKAPLPGYAKTRLAKQIGNEAAAKLAARMLHNAIEQAVAAGLGPVELCCSPDSGHPIFAELQQKYGVTLTLQGEGDLGARMQRALARGLQQHQQVLLTGTDAPRLDAATLRLAAEALSGNSAVFAPTFDGGYALVGVTQDIPQLFADMPWSTERVMSLSRERLAEQALPYAELAMLNDVDEPQDLVHVPADWLAH
jgi:rSAM/selenodomain-associated transferase 1